jgi:hypothetical protein
MPEGIQVTSVRNSISLRGSSPSGDEPCPVNEVHSRVTGFETTYCFKVGGHFAMSGRSCCPWYSAAYEWSAVPGSECQPAAAHAAAHAAVPCFELSLSLPVDRCFVRIVVAVVLLQRMLARRPCSSGIWKYSAFHLFLVSAHDFKMWTGDVLRRTRWPIV